MRVSRNLLRWWITVSLVAAVAFGADFLKAREEPKKKKPSDVESLKEIKDFQDFGAVDDESEAGDSKYNTKIETPLIGDYMTFSGINAVTIEGVGLVVGLNGTGGNPAPSRYRTVMVDDLKRRGVRNPNEILRSPDTALVYLRATLPPLLEKGETIDVQVMIPESAEATSLEGGWLMEAYLSEQAFVPGKGTLTGHHFAKAKGAILTAAAGADRDKKPALLARGVVLGGATVTRERELSIFLRNDFKMVRNALRVADAISQRFHDYDKHGIQQPMAIAKDDQKVSLLVHPKYKNNFPRYLQVVRHLAFREQPTARRLRIQRLKDELLNPEKSEKAALQLEGIGKEAIPVLKAGLESPLLECRFHAACALAYLEVADGVPVLAESARSEPAFRVYALAALSVIEDAEANSALRDLMQESSTETRYGAFRSLWVLDKNDPFIRGEKIESLEGKAHYMLHVIDSPGKPLVHVTTRARPEVVLFGSDQKLTTPCYLTAGQHIMVTAKPGAQTASVRRFAPNEPDQEREVPLTVANVVRAVSELDGAYPDVVQLLMAAAQQNNLSGDFTHDALPEAGRMYERPQPKGKSLPKSSRKTRIGRDNLTPNMFPTNPDKDKDQDAEELQDDLPAAMANVPPKSKKSAADKEPKTASVRKPETKSRVEAEDEDVEPESQSRPRIGFWPKSLTPRVHRFDDKNQVELDPPQSEAKPKSPERPQRKPKAESEKSSSVEEDLSANQSEPE